jgi:transcriptional regulator with XRE-family HTH domain
LLRLKFLRITRGLRQKQLAVLVGVPRPYVSLIENGVRNPNAEELAALGRIFNCPPATLLDHVVDPQAGR